MKDRNAKKLLVVAVAMIAACGWAAQLATPAKAIAPSAEICDVGGTMTMSADACCGAGDGIGKANEDFSVQLGIVLRRSSLMLKAVAMDVGMTILCCLLMLILSLMAIILLMANMDFWVSPLDLLVCAGGWQESFVPATHCARLGGMSADVRIGLRRKGIWDNARAVSKVVK